MNTYPDSYFEIPEPGQDDRDPNDPDFVINGGMEEESLNSGSEPSDQAEIQESRPRVVRKRSMSYSVNDEEDFQPNVVLNDQEDIDPNRYHTYTTDQIVNRHRKSRKNDVYQSLTIEKGLYVPNKTMFDMVNSIF
jgi:hypothetical protein